jgi:hypothetical protein
MQEDPRDGQEPCVRLFTLDLAGNKDPTEVSLQTTCLAFNGAGGPDWTAWSEVGLHSEDLGESRGFAQSPDATLVDLGWVETGTMTTCGDWVYWQGREGTQQPQPLLRWQPGSSAEIVFEAGVHTLMGGQECAQGWLTVVVAEPGGSRTIYAAEAPG